MPHRVPKQRVVDTRSLLVEGGADHAEEFLEDIERGLENSELEAQTRWSIRQVAVNEGLLATGQAWLVVEHRRIRDVRQYVRCRPFGVHLEIVHLTVIEPPLWKAWTASLVAGGAWWCWSLPKGEFAEASLRSWLAVVGHVVQGAAKHLAQRLARGGAALRPLDPDVLAWW